MGKINIAVVGGGMMGASLAAMFCGNGYKTVLIERKGFTNNAEKNFDSVYTDIVSRELATKEQAEIAKSYLTVSDDYSKIENSSFLFECVFEKLDIKHACYKEIEKHGKNLKAFASSTSAISANELAKGLTTLKDRMLVAHPWNPPHLVPCIEVVQSEYTEQSAIEFTVDLLQKFGKEVILLKKDYPGFIGNRLQYAMLREAIHMVEEGVATAEEIDRTLKTSFAPRYTEIGIFEHFDNCGQDLTADIQKYLNPTLANEKSVQKSVLENCKNQNLGIKSGKGMLNWEGVDISAFRSRAASPYYRFLNWSFPKERCND